MRTEPQAKRHRPKTPPPPKPGSVVIWVEGKPGWAHLGLVPKRTVHRPKRRSTQEERLCRALDLHLGLVEAPAPPEVPTLAEPLDEETKYTPPESLHPAIAAELNARGYIWMKPRTRKARGSAGLTYVRGFWRRSRRKTSSNRTGDHQNA